MPAYKRLLIVMIIISMFAVPVFSRGNREAKEQYIAKVNGVGISKNWYNFFIDLNKQQYGDQYNSLNEEQKKQMQEGVIDQLITEEVLYQEAKSQGISFPENSVDEQFNQILQNYENKEAFISDLEKDGLNEEVFRDYLVRNGVINKLLDQELKEQTEISEQEMNSFYNENTQYFMQPEQVDARHILFVTEELDDAEKEEAFEKAQRIRETLINGADFEETAKEVSEGPSAQNGGKLGTFSKGQMVPAFEETAFALNVGEISEVVETRFGYHIIQVTDKIEATQLPFEKAKPTIEKYLTQVKQEEAFKSYLEELKSEAEIERL